MHFNSFTSLLSKKARIRRPTATAELQESQREHRIWHGDSDGQDRLHPITASSASRHRDIQGHIHLQGKDLPRVIRLYLTSKQKHDPDSTISTEGSNKERRTKIQHEKCMVFSQSSTLLPLKNNHLFISVLEHDEATVSLCKVKCVNKETLWRPMSHVETRQMEWVRQAELMS